MGHCGMLLTLYKQSQFGKNPLLLPLHQEPHMMVSVSNPTLRGERPGNDLLSHEFWDCLSSKLCILIQCRRSQWPRGLRRRSTAARLLRLWIRNPPGAWMFFCCECFALSGRGLCDELITRPEESYRLWCVVVCDLENLMNEEPYPINVTELNIGDTSLEVFPTCH